MTWGTRRYIALPSQDERWKMFFFFSFTKGSIETSPVVTRAHGGEGWSERCTVRSNTKAKSFSVLFLTEHAHPAPEVPKPEPKPTVSVHLGEYPLQWFLVHLRGCVAITTSWLETFLSLRCITRSSTHSFPVPTSSLRVSFVFFPCCLF